MRSSKDARHRQRITSTSNGFGRNRCGTRGMLLCCRHGQPAGPWRRGFGPKKLRFNRKASLEGGIHAILSASSVAFILVVTLCPICAFCAAPSPLPAQGPHPSFSISPESSTGFAGFHRPTKKARRRKSSLVSSFKLERSKQGAKTPIPHDALVLKGDRTRNTAQAGRGRRELGTADPAGQSSTVRGGGSAGKPGGSGPVRLQRCADHGPFRIR